MAGTPLLRLAMQLISRPSITPHDEQCQDLLAEHLHKVGFRVESMPFGEVNNFYARRGKQDPVILFAGHTDVVPPGPIDKWTTPPFEPHVRDGKLYGRGAADMKSSLAAMVCACESFIKDYPQHKGSIAFLITSDEEGKATEGTVKVIEKLIERNEAITWCIVGEASSEKKFGDVVKVGRRGSLSARLIIKGKQGHIAYPDKAVNPIHAGLAALDVLTKRTWDDGNEFFPPTSLQISNIHAGTGADNVIPDNLEALFNFRYSTAITEEQIKQQVADLLAKYEFDYQLHWHLSGKPFLSSLGKLFQASCNAIEKITGQVPIASTSGGASDGRFIIKTGCEILEIGPINASIHQIDENINVADLDQLCKVYYQIMVELLV